MTTGPKSPRTAAETSNAGTRGPCSNQVALAVSMHEATHPKGWAVLDAGGRSQRHREQRLELIVGVQRDPGSSQGAEWETSPSPSSVSLLSCCYSWPSCVTPETGWAATKAPLMPPIEVPSTRSGSMLAPPARPTCPPHLGGAEPAAASQDEGDGMLDRARRI
ncbi:MAG: hypothetical protein H0V69_04175 [Acidimicrobiia bacterium]|nr:hypothetical protein [Acidimicrobiia bacterium]